MTAKLRAPFPYFGGKSKVAPLVWRAFGDVNNYVEPFFGSGAVLLGRPHLPKIETVNDINCYVANFHRAIQADPAGVADWADAPVNEADLHARHEWLRAQAEFRERMHSEAEFYDVRVAGWWVWGLCAWIGSGWCALDRKTASRQVPHLTTAGKAIHAASVQSRKLPRLDGRGVSSGVGVNPRMASLGHSGRGIHSPDREGLVAWFSQLRDRIRRVRVACGDWSRVVRGSVTGASNLLGNMGMQPCGVFLDPPYAGEEDVYGADGVSAAVREWAVANGDNRTLRIALCGYEGEHDMPATWACVPWKAGGGYGNRNGGDANDNARRERIWFSPHCLPLVADQVSLFGVGGDR